MILKTLLLTALFFSAPRDSFWRDVGRLRYGDVPEEITDEEVIRAIKSLPTHYAFTDFYIDSGGNDLNAGSVVNSAAVYTSSNAGTWDGASVYTPSDGSTPASTVSAGMWMSVYVTAGATVATYIAQVTTVAAGVNGAITLSTTAKYGTAPTSGTNSRTVRVGGSWSTLLPTTNAGPASGSTAVPASTRFNIQAGAYAQTTNNRTFSYVATATAVVEWSGYKTTPGDLNNIPAITRIAGTDMPQITYTTGHQINSGAMQKWSTIAFLMTGAGASGVVLANGAQQHYHRCRFENQQATSTCNAITTGGGQIRMTQCWAKATTTATSAVSGTGAAEIYDCAIEGGVSNIAMSSGSFAVDGCTLANAATQCILWSTSGTQTFSARGNTFYNPGTDGCLFSTMPTTGFLVFDNNLFHTIPGAPIKNSSGTNSTVLVATSNVYWRIGGSSTPPFTHLSGFGDTVEWDAIDEPADPVVSATNLNFTLKSSALCFQKAAPQLFENQPNNMSYGSAGGVIMRRPPRVRHRLGMRD